jgi:hypothetical protein
MKETLLTNSFANKYVPSAKIEQKWGKEFSVRSESGFCKRDKLRAAVSQSVSRVEWVVLWACQVAVRAQLLWVGAVSIWQLIYWTVREPEEVECSPMVDAAKQRLVEIIIGWED